MNRKKKILISLVIIVGLATVIFYNFNYLTPSDEVKIVNDEKKLVVGFDSEFPPFEFENSYEEYVGFDLDIAQEIADRNGWELVKKPIVWSEKDTELESGQIDCIYLEYPHDSSEISKYAWTKPILNLGEVFVVRSDSGINSTADLSGKVLELQEGSESENFLENDNVTLYDQFKKVVKVEDYSQAFSDLAAGKCDVIILDKTVALYNIDTNCFDFKVVSDKVTVEPYCIAFSSNNTELSKQVQKTLDDMYKDGTIEKIAEKYKAFAIPTSLLNSNG